MSFSPGEAPEAPEAPSHPQFEASHLERNEREAELWCYSCWVTSDESHNLSGCLSVLLVSRDSWALPALCFECRLNKAWPRNTDVGKQMFSEVGVPVMGLGSPRVSLENAGAGGETEAW